MHVEPVEPFRDNWTYLKTELAWLDRMLGMAVARQRKDTRDVNLYARSSADRVTSHWWKGLISLDGEASYDMPVESKQRLPVAARPNYQQQLEAKIRVSHQQAIALALPTLCDRLKLTLFEKNLVLMALAPEISRRYGKLYNYLQETEQPESPGLPVVDLILRLLCRNEAEWRSARQSLAATSPLIRYRLIEVQSNSSHPFLKRWVKLSDPLVNYLLAECPDSNDLEQLLQAPTDGLEQNLGAIAATPLTLDLALDAASASSNLTSGVQTWTPIAQPEGTPDDIWGQLVLPSDLLKDLQHLGQRLWFAQSQAASNDVNEPAELGLAIPLSGNVVLCVGASGTGKTSAARAIAYMLQTPLWQVDLGGIDAAQHNPLIRHLMTQAPMILVVKSAQVWFGRSSPLPEFLLQQFLAQRRSRPGITLLCVHQKQTVRPHWQRQFCPILEFPIPNPASRLKLWQRAFPPQTPLDATIDWKAIARKLILTGGEIRATAGEALVYAAASGGTVTQNHLMQASRFVKSRPTLTNG